MGITRTLLSEKQDQPSKILHSTAKESLISYKHYHLRQSSIGFPKPPIPCLGSQQRLIRKSLFLPLRNVNTNVPGTCPIALFIKSLCNSKAPRCLDDWIDGRQSSLPFRPNALQLLVQKKYRYIIQDSLFISISGHHHEPNPGVLFKDFCVFIIILRIVSSAIFRS